MILSALNASLTRVMIFDLLITYDGLKLIFLKAAIVSTLVRLVYVVLKIITSASRYFVSADRPPIIMISSEPIGHRVK